MTSKCSCGGNCNITIFACSGCADVGALADRGARALNVSGAGKMSCIAGVGGGIDTFLKIVENADKILAIDGCHVDCTKKILENHNAKNILHLRLSDIDLRKGESPVTDERIMQVYEAGLKLLNN